jgi:hypothetical protein
MHIATIVHVRVLVEVHQDTVEDLEVSGQVAGPGQPWAYALVKPAAAIQ